MSYICFIARLKWRVEIRERKPKNTLSDIIGELRDIFDRTQSQKLFIRRIGKTSGKRNRRKTTIFLAFAYTQIATRGLTERAATPGKLKPLPVITDAVANFSRRIRAAGISLRE